MIPPTIRVAGFEFLSVLLELKLHVCISKAAAIPTEGLYFESKMNQIDDTLLRTEIFQEIQWIPLFNAE